MESFKPMFKVIVTIAVLITGALGILLVLNLIEGEAARELAIKLFQILGIITGVAVVLKLLKHLDR